MSRVFDALQEAARLRVSNGTPDSAVWTELGLSPTATPEITKEVPAPAARAIREVVEIAPPKPEPALAQPPAASPVGIPNRIALDKGARAIPHSTDPSVVEHYRMLRTKILQEREKKFFKSLVITSASPQEGKTVTVLNLALSFAALPAFRVLVIDGDMRKGTLGEWLGIDSNQPGLSNLIEGSAVLEQVLLTSEDLGLSVIPRGNVQVSDLQSSQLSALFRQLSEQYDLILLDTPPVNIITDVQIMAANCDAVLLVARAFATTSKSLEEAVEKLHTFRIIGSVLNGGTPRRSKKYHGYYYRGNGG